MVTGATGATGATGSEVVKGLIAAVGIAALTEPGHAGKAYALSGGQAFTYGEAAEIRSRAASKPIRYVAFSEEDFSGSLAAQGWQPEQIALFTGLFHGVRQGWAAPISPDVAAVLGRVPHHPGAVRAGSLGDLAISSYAPGSQRGWVLCIPSDSVSLCALPIRFARTSNRW